MAKPLVPPAAAAFVTALALTLGAAVFLTACEQDTKDGGLAITDVIADGDSAEDPDTSTGKLTIWFNEDIQGLKAEDVKLTAAFIILKHGLTRTGPGVYELAITPGASGKVNVGLDPYNPAGWKWKAKTVNVYAVYHFTGTTALTITRYNGSGGEIGVPEKIAGIPVTSVAESAFYVKYLTGHLTGYLDIHDSIKFIGRLAFANNQLDGVSIPGGVRTIGNDAFTTNLLTDIKLSDGLDTIGDGAFSYNRLTKIDIPDSVTHIGRLAFASNQLTEVIINPDKVIFIGDGAFQNNQMSSFKFPNDIEIIRNSMFAYNQFESVEIPESIKNIGSRAFAGNKLKKVTFPEGIESIGSGAFAYNQLKEIEFLFPENVETIVIGDSAFENNFLTEVDIPENVTKIGRSVFANNQLTKIIIKGGVTSIGDSAFAYNELVSITIEEGVAGEELTIIGSYAFRNNRLKEVVIPDTDNLYIGDYAFRNNPLISIKIGEKVSLGRDAFGDGFEAFYNANEKKAGVYTRLNAGSIEWEFSEP